MSATFGEVITRNHPFFISGNAANTHNYTLLIIAQIPLFVNTKTADRVSFCKKIKSFDSNSKAYTNENRRFAQLEELSCTVRQQSQDGFRS